VQRCAPFGPEAETKVSFVDEIGQEIGRYVSEDVSVFDTPILRFALLSGRRIDPKASLSRARQSFAL